MDSEIDTSRRASILRAISFKEGQDPDVFLPENGFSPMSHARRPSVHFDAATTMHRLRNSMVGLAQLRTVSTADESLTSASEFSSTSGIDGLSSEESTKDTRRRQNSIKQQLLQAMGQVPAIALIAIFHLMIGTLTCCSRIPSGQ